MKTYKELDNTPISEPILNDYIDSRIAAIESVYGDSEVGQDNANNLAHRNQIKTWGEWFDTISATMESIDKNDWTHGVSGLDGQPHQE